MPNVIDAKSPLVQGVRAALTTPGTYILMLGFFGFGGFAREAGFGVFEGTLMSAATWALPSQVLLVGGVIGGASLGAVALIVTASAIRMLPMMASLIPLIAPRTPRPLGRLMLLASFQAITSWLELQRRLPAIPESERIAFAAGLGGTIWLVNVATTTVGMMTAGGLPIGAQGALALLLPAYFLFGLVAAWHSPSDAVATATGVVLGPLLAPMFPGSSLLWAGLLAGTFAFALQRWLPIGRAPQAPAMDGTRDDARPTS